MTGISSRFALLCYRSLSPANLYQVQEFVPGESFAPPSTTVRQYVAGEATDAYGGIAPEEHIPLPPPTEVALAFTQPQAPVSTQPQAPVFTQPQAPVFTQPQAPVPITTVEPSITEPEERHKALDQGRAEPLPTQEQRKFSAPHIKWDATR